MKIRASWSGELPKPGDFLISKHRPKFAYRIISFVDKVSAFPLATWAMLTLDVEKVKLDQVPDDAVIHNWKWDPRTKKSEAWRG